MKRKLGHRIATAFSPSQLKVTFGLAKYALISSLRNKGSYFFGLGFPLIFIFIFGSLGNGTSKTNIAVVDGVSEQSPVYVALKSVADQTDSPISLVRGSHDDLESKLNGGDVAAVIDAGENQTNIKLLTSNTNPSGGAAAAGFVQGVVNQLNLQAAKAPATFSVTPQEISGKSLRVIDFLLPGQIGLSLLFLCTFGVAFPFLTLRKTLVLKRMFATTVKPLSFVISQCLARSVQGVLQALVIILVGKHFYNFTLAHGWVTVVQMLILVFIAVLSFLGFGILVANIANDEQTVPVALNLFNLPQMLLGGVFFAADGLPSWLQKIGDNLPLSYLNEAMRKVAIDGAGFRDIYTYILGMVAWAAVVYILAAKTFKTE